MKVTFLGTGTSRGIPVIACNCRICTSTDPKNKRLRCSVLVESGATIVIDSSADFRFQMLKFNVQQLDAVVFTHSHVDHILGLDDVYPFNARSGKSLPIYASEETLKEIKITFRYLFNSHRYTGIPEIRAVPIEGKFTIADLEFEPISLLHGKLPILGFRIGDFAYLTDTSFIPEASFEQLKGLRFLALDALRYRSHPTHFSLSEAVKAAQLIGAEETYLIHMSHDVDHTEGSAFLPERISLAYDGLVLEL
ncbi:MAG: MBL fold metallo-hydrolase [Acidobacteriota bacterium]